MSKVLLHTPEGVRDIYGSECSDRLLVKEKIHQKMKSFGFEDIDTPTFEFFDIYSTEISNNSARELYKFFDSSLIFNLISSSIGVLIAQRPKPGFEFAASFSI